MPRRFRHRRRAKRRHGRVGDDRRVPDGDIRIVLAQLDGRTGQPDPDGAQAQRTFAHRVADDAVDATSGKPDDECVAGIAPDGVRAGPNPRPGPPWQWPRHRYGVAQRSLTTERATRLRPGQPIQQPSLSVPISRQVARVVSRQAPCCCRSRIRRGGDRRAERTRGDARIGPLRQAADLVPGSSITWRWSGTDQRADLIHPVRPLPPFRRDQRIAAQ